ncbi:FAD-dependent tricarballylate dehydrogenase TcuA [Alkalicoccobacillus gibsonii]|uniref:FAD-dependent tricarballylate dehydrogenase TcuA n=1 Tax=Alkalicoccobacillus gibsonii TaxID=79881 RepID=A0ABU9VN54_9BACI
MCKKDQLYDVVVVGAGNAALCAAIAARLKGVSVLVLEKSPRNKRGGNSFFTDGAIRCAYGHVDQIKTIVDQLPDEEMENVWIPPYDTKDFMNDLLEVTNGKSDLHLANQLVTLSFSTIQWLKEQGVTFQLNENQCFTDGKKKTFWGGLPLRTNNKGVGLMESLHKRATELEIDIWYESCAKDITLEEGKVDGLIIDKENTTIRLKANSVILACGSFEASAVKRSKYLGEEWAEAIVRGTEYNTGDGLDMAEAIGAKAYGSWSSCHAHTTDFNAPKYGDFNKPGDIYKKSSYPLGLIINVEGNRFVDEGADFRNYTYAKYGKETLQQPEQKAYQLFDSQVRDRLRSEYNLEEATVYQADSLEELAEKLALPEENFVNTIQTYNQAVQEGDYNPAVKDGKGTRGIVPAKSNWALRFDKPPYYAYPVTCGITFAFGGVKIDHRANIVNHQDHPITGLYAAGEMVGGLFFDNYPGGSGLMSGAVFGKIAGESAAVFSVEAR